MQVAVVAVPKAKTAADAAAQAWRLTKPAFSYALHLAQPLPPKHGWDEVVEFDYDVPPAEKGYAQAVAYRNVSGWTVVTVDGALATTAKRWGQLAASTETLHPVGYVEETFAGKQAHRMNATRIDALKRFVQTSMATLQIPGVGLSIVDHGRIVYEGGLGAKDVGTGAPVDKDTLFMIASNTKGMTTLLLASLVDEGKLDWNRPVIDYMPGFRLGDDAVTRKVLVKHLVCACTGLPRRDMETMFNGNPDAGAASVFAQLASTQPTSGFGEVYQYSNTMASAAGYLAAHVAWPQLPLAEGYDRAMQERVFDPLGMHDTTFSNARAMAGNWAKPYDTAIDGRLAPVDIRHDRESADIRPAGGAWSSAHDMALYVRDELDQGLLPDGRRLVSAQNLLARRVHNVPTGDKVWYGMGVEDDASSGVSVLHHGGSLYGYRSDWFAVPSAGVGVAVLTNSQRGYALTDAVKRRLLELLYDGRSEAASDVTVAAANIAADTAKLRSEVDLHATQATAASYLGRYANADLGPLTIALEGGHLMARSNTFWSEVASKRNGDGTTSLVPISPGMYYLELLVTAKDGKRALVLNDGQRGYVFMSAQPAVALKAN